MCSCIVVVLPFLLLSLAAVINATGNSENNDGDDENRGKSSVSGETLTNVKEGTEPQQQLQSSSSSETGPPPASAHQLK
jgi:hypothetical protein